MLGSLEGWESMCSEDAGEWVLWVREGGREGGCFRDEGKVLWGCVKD